jgi:ABC-type nitrate/sulfonate/bicarbonate transport system substrate-binding protein/signal transduction histidine kinase
LYRYFLFIIFLPFSLFAFKSLEKTTLQLSWFNQFQFAGYYIAKEKGFYADMGLNVEIRNYDFGVNVTKDVSVGKVDFGIARETLIQEKINTFHNLIALYPLFQISPLILIAKKDSNINTLKDFSNKRIMLSENDSSQASLKAMLTSNNINNESMEILKHSHNLEDLINNKTDIMSAYISKFPFNLEQKNIPFNIFAPKDYGFDLYSDFLFTSSELIKKNPEKVIAFKKASLKGWEYAYSHIEEATELILKKYNTQNLTKEELIYEANELKKLSYYKNNTLGNIDKNKLIRIYDIYRLMGYFEENDNPSDFIFDEYKPILNEEESKYLKCKDTLKMCVRDNFLPYESFLDKYPIGITSEYIKIIEKKLGINITVVPVNSLENGFLKLKTYNCDFISTIQNEDTKSSDILYTKSYLELPIVFVSTQKNLFITNFEQLKNKKIFISSNEELASILKTDYPYSKIYETPSVKFAFQQISSNNADGYIGNITEVIYYLQKNYNSELHITGNLDYKTDISFALRKDDLILEKILNKVIGNISKDEKELIQNDYSTLKYKEINNHKSLIITLLCCFIVISLLIIIYLREKLLKNKIQKLNTNLEKRILEESLKNRKKDETLFKQAKLASMGEMINNIAHQWRQPLNRINLSIQVIENILKDISLDFEQKELIDKKIFHINKNINYMSNTIEDFMNFFHPKKVKNNFYLNNLIKKAVSLIQNRDNNNIEIDIEIEKVIFIYSFENEFLQVILILLQNAIDCFKTSNITHKCIGIFASEEKEKITLIIKDNAGGIPAEIIDKIFEPYFTTKFKGEGSGIGLYMAKMIIEESIGGKLDVYSKNIYTNFKITLKKENTNDKS